MTDVGAATWCNGTKGTNGVMRVLHFQDTRPPQEIQFALERDLMVLFTPTMETEN